MNKPNEQKIEGIMAALFQLAHDLQEVSGDGPSASLGQIKRDLQSAGSTLFQDLVALNDGRGPDGKVADI